MNVRVLKLRRTPSIERIRDIPEYSGKYEFSCNFLEQIVKNKTKKLKIIRHHGIKGLKYYGKKG